MRKGGQSAKMFSPPKSLRFMYQASRIRLHVSGFTYQASRIRLHVSRITYHVSRITFHASPFTFHAAPFLTGGPHVFSILESSPKCNGCRWSHHHFFPFDFCCGPPLQESGAESCDGHFRSET